MSLSDTLRFTDSDFEPNATVPTIENVAPSGLLNPPQLLLSVESAKVRESPGANVPVKLSLAMPAGGQNPSAIGDAPERASVPVKVDEPLLVTVRNPVSGPAQIVSAEL